MSSDTGSIVILDQDYPSTLESVDIVEADILKAAVDAGFGEDEQHEVGMAVRECMVNAVVHGNRYNKNKYVHVKVTKSAVDFAIRITDQGEGVFPHVRSGLGLEDLFAAIQELTKGRTTTAPDRHTGEGIFFASKAVDVFALSSAGLTWTVDNLRNDQAVGISPVTAGTRVTCEIDPATDRSLAKVFARFTDDNFDFSRSSTVVHLFGLAVRFVSRSEAKRLLQGLDRFKQVEIDFTGVQDVGQGFVDELVRVWPVQHPGTTITPTHMNPAVEFMVRRGLRRSDPDAPQAQQGLPGR